MLYRVTGEEIATHRHIEISDWEAPDIVTAQRNAVEIGIIVSTIEPMESPAGHLQDAKEDNRTATAPEDDLAADTDVLVVPDTTADETLSLREKIIGVVILVLLLVGFPALLFFRPGTHEEHYELAQTQFSNSRVTVDESSLPEWKRQKIFCDLVAVLDLGYDDSVAMTLVERQYDVSEKTLREIAKEGLAKGWAMP